MKTITKLRRNSEALSPIFATLILIAIAVIAGIVVYMFTSGYVASMTGSGSAGAEKVTIQSASYATGGNVTLYAQSTGGPTPTVGNIIVKDASGNTVVVVPAKLSTATTSWTNGALVTVYASAQVTGVSAGTYTATLTTAAGGSFVSPTFSVTTP